MPDQDHATTPPADDSNPTHGSDTDPPEGDEPEPEDGQTFDAAYVRKLRAEAATHRTTKKELAEQLAEAQAQLQTLREAEFNRTVAEVAGPHLADPSDLVTFVGRDPLVGDDGLPDRDRIAEAAADLATRKPHLKRTVWGSAEGGVRTPPDSKPVEGLDSVLRRITRAE